MDRTHGSTGELLLRPIVDGIAPARAHPRRRAAARCRWRGRSPRWTSAAAPALVLLVVGPRHRAGRADRRARGTHRAGPVARFTRRTEALTADPDPSHRLEVEGRDELARLARSFNATLDALEHSVQAQRHLVADASHELRTPIASLRANVQVLRMRSACRRPSATACVPTSSRSWTLSPRWWPTWWSSLAAASRATPPTTSRLDQIVEQALETCAGGARPTCASRRTRAHAGARRAGSDRPRGGQPARQRREVERARRRRGG